MFLGRQKELAQIKSMLNSNKKQALMIYGKRRVGKSTLILEAIKKAKCKVIYYECLYTSLEENLRNIESRIQKAFNNNFLHFKSFSEILGRTVSSALTSSPLFLMLGTMMISFKSPSSLVCVANL
mgnify:CR=1 FL=1